MSSSDSVKDARFTFRADLRIESDKLASFESWLEEKLRHQTKTSLCTDALALLKKFDDDDGLLADEELSKMVADYQAKQTVKPRSLDVLKTAMKLLTEHDEKN